MPRNRLPLRLLLALAALTVLPSTRADASEPPRPGDLGGPSTSAWDQPPHRHTVFLNFEGGIVDVGDPNAAEMVAGCAPPHPEFPAWAGTVAEADAVLQGIREAMAPFGVRVVKERPPNHLPYSQVMLGGDPLGVANYACLVDCGDKWWRETGFVTMPVKGTQGWVNSTLSVIGRHAGLDFTADETLYSDAHGSYAERQWGTTCTPLTEELPVQCVSTHALLCGEGSAQQHDFAELVAVYGEDSADVVPPTVKLLAPADGEAFPAGAEVKIEAEITDDFDGFGWRLMLPEAGLEVPAYDGETTWTLKPPVGVHLVRVEAIDHDRNIGAAEITIHVGVAAPDGTTGEASTGEPSPTSGETSSDASDSSETSGETSSSGDGEDPGADPNQALGCDCSSATPPGPLALLALLALALVRRSRPVRGDRA